MHFILIEYCGATLISVNILKYSVFTFEDREKENNTSFGKEPSTKWDSIHWPVSRFYGGFCFLDLRSSLGEQDRETLKNRVPSYRYL